MTMRYYPINLDLNSRPCLVVGAGEVGARKVTTLLKCGAEVIVVSPKVHSDILDMFDQNRIKLKRREYTLSDIFGCFLVVGATDDEVLNHRISEDASRYNILCNIVDRPEICSFILPAIVARGDFLLTVSTAGKSPAFAKKLRQELELKFGHEYGVLLELMGAIRVKLFASSCEFNQHKLIFEKLLANDLLTLVKENKIEEIDSILHIVLGKDYNYRELMK